MIIKLLPIGRLCSPAFCRHTLSRELWDARKWESRVRITIRPARAAYEIITSRLGPALHESLVRQFRSKDL